MNRTMFIHVSYRGVINDFNGEIEGYGHTNVRVEKPMQGISIEELYSNLTQAVRQEIYNATGRLLNDEDITLISINDVTDIVSAF